MRCPVPALALLACGATIARAQQAVALDRHSRMAKNAVAAFPGADPSSFEVLDAAGGDAFVLRYSTQAPSGFQLVGGPGAEVLATRGVIVDIARLEPFVYLASFRGGLEAYDRSSAPPWTACGADPAAPRDCSSASAPCWAPPEDHDVRCVAAAEVGGERLVVVGTENRRVQQFDEPTGGTLFVLRHEPLPGVFHLLCEVDIGRPVLSVAAWSSFPSTGALAAADLSVLVGANAAHFAGNPAALQRFDFELQGASCSLLLRQGWTTTRCSGAPKNMVVRDLALDLEHRRAFVAAHWDGVWGFDIDPNSSASSAAFPTQVRFGLSPLANTFEPVAGGDCEACPSADWPLRVWADAGLAAGCALGCEPGAPATTCGAVEVRALTAYASCLALTPLDGLPDEQHLTIGWGLERLLSFNTVGQFAEITRERSYLDPSGADEPANVSCGASFNGLDVQRLSGGAPLHESALGALVAPQARIELPTHPMALDATRGPGGELIVFVCEYLIATRAYRLQLAPGAPCARTHKLQLDGAWGPGPPGHIPGLAVLGLAAGTVQAQSAPLDMLYATTESSLVAFWLDPSNPRPLSRPQATNGAIHASNPLAPYFVRKACIRLAAAFEQGASGVGARLVAATDKGRASSQNSGGIRVFELSEPAAPSASDEPRTELAREGQGYSVALASGLADVQPPPPAAMRERYLYAPYRDGLPGRNTGVKVWSLGTADEPRDPRPAPSVPWGPHDNRVRLIGEYTPPNAALLTLDSIAVLQDASPTKQVVYVLYGAASGIEGPLGLLALQVRKESGAPPSTTELRLSPLGPGSAAVGTAWRGQYDADARCDRSASGFTRDYYPSGIALDATRRRIWCAWAGVLAMYGYDASGPVAFVPQLLDARDFSATPGAYGMTRWFTSIAAGPVRAGELFVYVSIASDGLGILSVGPDAAPNVFGALKVLTLPWQSTWIEVDRRDPSGLTLFVGQGSAGVDWRRLCWTVAGN
jgi:hypothetical protein